MRWSKTPPYDALDLHPPVPSMHRPRARCRHGSHHVTPLTASRFASSAQSPRFMVHMNSTFEEAPCDPLLQWKASDL
jgi:hypothetical protein